MTTLSLSIINTIEKKITNADTFQYIANDNSEDVIDALTQISVRSGQAVYIWLSDSGLVNIKSRQTPLPSTKSLLEAIKYATKNHYYAVYVFPAYNSNDLLEVKATLPNAKLYLEKTKENTRFLFLINEGIVFNYLTKNAEEIELVNKHTKKYKLRDGNWVLSSS